jgi:hypothetical protein
MLTDEGELHQHYKRIAQANSPLGLFKSKNLAI